MTDLNACLAQKRTALDGRRERIGCGAVGPVLLRAEATMEGRSGVRRIRVREHGVISDSLPDFAGDTSEQARPSCNAGPLGACFADSFPIQAAAHGIPLDTVTVEVTTTCDPRSGETGYEDVPVHLSGLAYTTQVALGEDSLRPKHKRAAWDDDVLQAIVTQWKNSPDCSEWNARQLTTPCAPSACRPRRDGPLENTGERHAGESSGDTSRTG